MRGVIYERKVQAHLLERFAHLYHPSPWFTFWDSGGTPGRESRRWCQPDGLLLDPWLGTIIICEIKYQHTSDAWWQLRRLYLPVVRAAFPATLWSISCLEIVKWYDPATLFPEPTVLLYDPSLRTPRLNGCIGVHIFR